MSEVVNKQSLFFKVSACIAEANRPNMNWTIYTEDCLKGIAEKDPDKFEFKDRKLYFKGDIGFGDKTKEGN